MAQQLLWKLMEEELSSWKMNGGGVSSCCPHEGQA